MWRKIETTKSQQVSFVAAAAAAAAADAAVGEKEETVLGTHHNE